MPELPNTALITGGARGIGREIVFALAREGWQVFFTHLPNETELADDVVQRIRSDGGSGAGFILDIRNRDDVASFFQNNIQKKVFLDVLVNNAGITKDGFLVRMKLQDWQDVINVNLDGTFFCLQEAAKIMLKQRKGTIVNIASLVGQTGNPGQANYCASKAGIIGLTKAAALELAPRGIRVNAVAPGFIATEMTQQLDEDIQKKYLEKIPLSRYGTPEDVAAAVVWLATNSSSYITGQVIGVNGGMYL